MGAAWALKARGAGEVRGGVGWEVGGGGWRRSVRGGGGGGGGARLVLHLPRVEDDAVHREGVDCHDLGERLAGDSGNSLDFGAA